MCVHHGGESTLLFLHAPSPGPIWGTHVVTCLLATWRRSAQLVPGGEREGSFLGQEEERTWYRMMRLHDRPVTGRGVRWGAAKGTGQFHWGTEGCVWGWGLQLTCGSRRRGWW